MSTTVQVDKHTAQNLKTLKELWGLKTLNEVIECLMADKEGEDDGIGGSSDGGGEMDEGDDDVRKGKLDQGVFTSALAGDPKAVKHFTGLAFELYNWVVGALKDAVRECDFFYVVWLLAMGAFWGPS